MAEGVDIGWSRVDEESIAALRKAWSRKRLVLLLGAGVSAQYGLPDWERLVTQIAVDPNREAKDLERRKSSALLSWVSRDYGLDPLMLGRAMEIAIARARPELSHDDVRRELLESVRAHLYATVTRPSKGSRTTLQAVADLLEAGSERKGGVAAVVTLNFDDLLERELRRRRIRCVPVWEATPDPGAGIPILHPHGFLPQRGEIPDQRLVLTESDFHLMTESVVNWASGEIASYLRNYTVLFIGLSLADPNLRRLLDATRRPAAPHSRFLFRKRYRLPSKNRRELMQLYVADKAGFDPGELKKAKGQVAFGVLVDRFDKGQRVAQMAADLESLVFDDMGVGVLWVSRFEDIGLILDYLPNRKRLPRAGA